ncbi:hypothetical protein ATN84_14250 [Paramesorhizobium deserti]|uniref:Uncharacterized protein n=1 Tax=Paramesorhizobium deserti TaxID=1494590 RepID=A0A135HTE3_9HYPH|nr:DUF459 domain-containing protein [Paramesorhizobium deserti]KXF76448.1 hypothetical protein ATN84_14250 [Paramesorhizobium deserti]
MLIIAAMPDASAQGRPKTLLDLFFGRREAPPDYYYDPPPRRVTRPSKPSTRNRSTSGRSTRSRAPAVADTPSRPPAPAPVEKNPDAKTVLVIGDFIGGGLAEGLEEALAQNPDVRVANRVNGSSGFVRTDHYDWPAKIKGILDEEKPAAIVVMIGANDRQPITIEGTSQDPRTPTWTAEYTKRVEGFVDTIKKAGYPLVWVGQPPFKPRGMSQDILAFNEIYRNATEKAGGSFADVWDGFVDESGNFALSGFDINGQTARLRANDGINITQAGKRKLAFYAEKPLRQLLGDALSPDAAPKPGDLPQPPPETAKIPAKIDRIAPVSLKDLDLDSGNELLGAHLGKSLAPIKSARDLLVIDGVAAKPQPGRADDFTWPRKPTLTAKQPVPTDDTTTGTTP